MADPTEQFPTPGFPTDSEPPPPPPPPVPPSPSSSAAREAFPSRGPSTSPRSPARQVPPVPGTDASSAGPAEAASAPADPPGQRADVSARSPYGAGYRYGQASGGPGPAPTPPGTSLDLAKLVGIGAWVVLGLYVVAYLYGLAQDDPGRDSADRFFGQLPLLAQGIFLSGVLHAVAVWLGRERRVDD